MKGYLAYRGGKPIGWCNAAPRTMLCAFNDEPDPDAVGIGQITCFIVVKSQRGTGVAKALLRAACAGFQAQNLRIVEATANPKASSDAEHHYGPLSMYLAEGFAVHSTDEDGYVSLRLHLS